MCIPDVGDVCSEFIIVAAVIVELPVVAIWWYATGCSAVYVYWCVYTAFIGASSVGAECFIGDGDGCGID